ncbi:MAG: hypothetical protein P1U32_03915, partial [Legionellaceae bacterium]|nr:hypothetical protein [Legionellaceae bacterium]
MALTQAQAQQLLSTYKPLYDTTQLEVTSKKGGYFVPPGPNGGAYIQVHENSALRKAFIPEILNTLTSIANNTEFTPQALDSLLTHFTPSKLTTNEGATAYLEQLIALKENGKENTFLEHTIDHFTPHQNKDALRQFPEALAQAKQQSEARLNLNKEIKEVGEAKEAKKAREAAAGKLIAETIYGQRNTLKSKAAERKTRDTIVRILQDVEKVIDSKEPKKETSTLTTENSSDATFYINCLASIAAIGGAAICIAALVTGQPLAVVAVSLARTAIGFMA